MIGWTLGGYFFRRFAVITGWNFAGIAALVFIVTFTENSARFSELEGFSPQWALGLALLQLPIIMMQAVPFVGLISAMAALVSLNRKYELVVTRAAGISAWQFLTPIAFGAFAFGLAAVLILNPIAAAGFSKAQELEAQVRGADTRTTAENERWLKQRTGDTETIIGADAALSEGRTLIRPIFIRIDEDGDIIERIDAERAFLREGFWEVRDATRRAGTAAPEAIETLSIKTNLQPEYVGERLTLPESLSIFELPGKIEVARTLGLRANAFAMHFHSLVTLPPLLVAMALIAATVSMRFARMGQSATVILGGVFAGFLLYVTSVLVKAFGSAGFVPPFIAAWTPVLVAMFFGVTFLLYREDG
ncbi:LPS export ABC transporter permease LptG [Nitratireductor sp. CH_MIT9313-5]|uniref:LPS export ABC transporter permease LptG n=1 Tax=Nitratireductor sp. CH_MIT9313-5 TaxID=3107764 RepID=UPI00300BA9A1